jgi:hypothetical protein
MSPRACAPRAQIAPDHAGSPAAQRAFAFAPGIRSAANSAIPSDAVAPCRVMPGPWRPMEQAGPAAESPWPWRALLSGLWRRLRVPWRDGGPRLDTTRLSDHLMRDLGLTNHVEQPPRTLSRRR